MTTATFLRTGSDRRRAGGHPDSVQIVGLQDRHLGPRMDYARVTLSAEPAERFEIVDALDERDPVRAFGYVEDFTKGLSEVLDNRRGRPSVRLTLQSATHHPVDSSPHAFTEAGRDAGRKLLELIDR